MHQDLDQLCFGSRRRDEDDALQARRRADGGQGGGGVAGRGGDEGAGAGAQGLGGDQKGGAVLERAAGVEAVVLGPDVCEPGQRAEAVDAGEGGISDRAEGEIPLLDRIPEPPVNPAWMQPAPDPGIIELGAQHPFEGHARLPGSRAGRAEIGHLVTGVAAAALAALVLKDGTHLIRPFR